MNNEIWRWAHSEETVPLEDFNEEYIIRKAQEKTVLDTPPKDILGKIIETISRGIHDKSYSSAALEEWFREHKPESLFVEEAVDLQSATLSTRDNNFTVYMYGFRTTIKIENIEIECYAPTYLDTNLEEFGNIILKIFELRESFLKAYQEIVFLQGKYKAFDRLQSKVIPQAIKEFKELSFSRKVLHDDKPGYIVTLTPQRTYDRKLFVRIPYDASEEEIRKIFEGAREEIDMVSKFQYLQGDFVTPIKFAANKVRKGKSNGNSGGNVK